MDNNDIIQQLDECKDIIKKDLGNNIYSYNFSRNVFYKDLWNDLTCKARGLFINKTDNTIIARSYDKFFYISDINTFHYPVRAFVKENGFLGILSWDVQNDKPFIASKTTNIGKHVEIFEKRLKELVKDKNYLTQRLANWNDLCDFLRMNNVSMVFEVVDIIDDPHIISYNSSSAVLLDIIYNDFNFHKYTYKELQDIAHTFDIPCKYLCKTLNNKEELSKWLEEITSPTYRNELEGYVLEDSSGFMCKVKTPFYNLWKRARSLRDYIVRGKEIVSSDIRSAEELDIYRFLLTVPVEVLKEMSVPILRDRYYFEKMKDEKF